MTLPSPTAVKDPAVQQGLDEIRKLFPLGPKDVAYNAITGDVTISAAGVSAIGVSTVTSSMIVNGTITDVDVNASAAIAASKLDPKLAQSTVENLKIIRGTVDTTGSGSIVSGLGFTISSRPGTGQLVLAFTAAFSDVASVTATVVTGGNFVCTARTQTSGAVTLVMATVAASPALADGIMAFTAIGPR